MPSAMGRYQTISIEDITLQAKVDSISLASEVENDLIRIDSHQSALAWRRKKVRERVLGS